MKHTTTFLFLMLVLISCKQNIPQASDIEVKWNLIENNYQGQAQHISNFIFVNRGKQEIKDNWAFYFNTINVPHADSTSMATFEHVNGDLYRLIPKKKFSLPSGDSCVVKTISANWVTSYTDAPTGGFFVFNKDIKGAFSTAIKLGPILETPAHTTRNARDVKPVETAEFSYNKYLGYGIQDLPNEKLIPIIPTPKKYLLSNAYFTLDGSVVIFYQDKFKNEADFLATQLKSNLDAQVQVEPFKNQKAKGIYLLEKGQDNAEAYQLKVQQEKVTITASSAKGIFYGIQSFRNLLPAGSYKSALKSLQVQAIEVEDEPLFVNRSIFLDVARNFQSKESVLKLLDLMALYKLNRFHFHFCDDEGWRVEIKAFPELTETGAYRYFSDDPNVLLPSFGSGPHKEGYSGSGFFTRKDFIDILKYATERHIEVIPEIDMPGHSRAAIKSMNVRYLKYKEKGDLKEAEKYLLVELGDSSIYRSVQGWTDNVVNVCQPGLYNFIDVIVHELKQMFDEAGAELKTIHSGGDEVPSGVWQKSALCQKFLAENAEYTSIRQLQSHFVEEFKKILDKYHITTAGWEEIVLKQENGKWVKNDKMVGQNYSPYIWNSVWGEGMEDLSCRLSNLGYKTVLCNVTNLYMDMAYVKNPEEPGYYWGDYTDARKFYEFTPFDIRNCAYEDNMGHKINAQELFKGKEQLSESGKKNILGLEGLLWTENTKSPQTMEYMIFPKLIALAERAWAQQPEWSKIADQQARLKLLNQNWNVFANTLGKRELPKLDYFDKGVNYRIPVPAGVIKNDTLYAAIEFPGFVLKYTTNGSVPDLNSETYTKPVSVSGNVKMKCFSTSGRSSRLVSVNK